MTKEAALKLKNIQDVTVNVIKAGVTYRMGGQDYFGNKTKLLPSVEDENGTLRPNSDSVGVTILYRLWCSDGSVDSFLATTYVDCKDEDEARELAAELMKKKS